jgi:hypothetical protein
VECIPFVNTETDCAIVSESFASVERVRLQLEAVGKLDGKVAGKALWIDTGVDGLARQQDANQQWTTFMSVFPGFADARVPGFIEKPDKNVIGDLARGLLNAGMSKNAAWLSVPQVPYVDGAERNKINRLFAKAAGEWKVESGFSGDLVLPVILTNQRQTNLKADRTAKIALASDCFVKSQATVLWVVDASLDDQSGSKTLEQKRFPGIVHFHEELGRAISGELVRIGGPYWGLNVVLWARGLIDYPAVGLGNGYQYSCAGGIMKAGNTRIALTPLRRLAVVSAELESWLREALKKLAPRDAAYQELKHLLDRFSVFESNKRASRRQVATHYSAWLQSIQNHPPNGRALALYQDLSSAYVLGKGLPALPKTEDTARRPEVTARQLMLSCL